MKNTSILIPIILIGCLLALALLITRAFAASDADDAPRQDPIVLDQDDYRDPEDDFDSYYQEVPEDEVLMEDEVATQEPGYDSTPTLGGGSYTNDNYTNEDTGTATPSSTATSDYPDTDADGIADRGRYLVIAGSFRQMVNAEARVTNLRNAGFSAAVLEKFNRGTYAVALAGRSDSYTEARSLADRIRRAGFESRVMQKR